MPDPLRRPTFLTIVSFLTLLAACESSPSDPQSEPLSLRFANDTAEPITVAVVASENLPAEDRRDVDFGTVGPQQISEYRVVSEAFFVLVDGLPFPDEDMPFGISDPPSPRWTVRIQPGGGWSQDADFD